MNKKTQLVLTSLAAALVAAGCASGPSVAELNDLTDKIVKASFRDQSHVKVERITATDETNRVCSDADVAGKPLSILAGGTVAPPAIITTTTAG